MIASRKRPMKARSVSTCKHWLSGLLKCSVCGATPLLHRKRQVSILPMLEICKGISQDFCSPVCKKGRRSCDHIFDQILSGATLHTSARMNQLQTTLLQLNKFKGSCPNSLPERTRIRGAYESGIDTLEEYKSQQRPG